MKINRTFLIAVLIGFTSQILFLAALTKSHDLSAFARMFYFIFAFISMVFAIIGGALSQGLIANRKTQSSTFIIWPRKVITEVCDEIPTKVEWMFFCYVDKPCKNNYCVTNVRET